MAFNPSPKVAVARDFARIFGKTKVIVLMFDDGTMEYASFGQTPALCSEAKELAEVAYDAIHKHLAGEVEPRGRE